MFRPTTRAVAAAVALVVCALSSAATQAAAPMAKTNAPGFFRFMLGQFEVTALNDGTVDLPVDKLLAEPPAKTEAALARSYLKAPLETSDNGFLINTGSKLVLIDAGAGSLFGPTLGKLVDNLKASGYEPSQVDEIYITHAHPDHVGGLVANGTRVFPNAVVRTESAETDYWLSDDNLAKAPAEKKGFFQGAMASLRPYSTADKYRAFDGDTELVPGIRAVASHGHTPGHASYWIESDGQRLLIAGDLIHVAAVQFDHPEVTIGFDSDAKAAAASRDTLFHAAAKQGAIVGAAHLQFPGLGHVRVAGKHYDWLPLNYTRLR